MISFIISGKPIALKRHRPSAKGGYYDPSSKDKKDIWLQIAKYKPVRPLEGNIFLKVTFYMPRPKSHYRTGKYKHLLKDRCKDIIYHKTVPDLDNLIKFYSDLLNMNKGFYVDDSQICWISATKIYGDPRTEVMIEEI